MKYLTTILLLISQCLIANICNLESEIPSTTPDSRFVDNGNGTITDSGTGLMWQKCQLGLSGLTCNIGSSARLSWRESLNQARLNNLAGYSDWRLPNIKELRSIVEQRCYSPSINTKYFPSTASYWFWTSSPSFIHAVSWAVSFGDGPSLNFVGRNDDDEIYVRLVRSL